jgi:acyl carrier protein
VTTLTDALLRFVREDLLRGRDVAIGPDTYLFEDGVVDSLGILTLIAFVEQQCGRTIPDGEIVMEHFRNIRAIARHFESAS